MYRNATHAFVDGLRKILQEGQVISVRGQEVRELRSHLIRIASPLERVLVVPQRNNNIFAMIAETIWVIAGRSDLAYLSRYLPRAVDFSDDGQVWRGGYGPRLRNWQGVDQFREVARILNEDRNSRRAVMIIFDPLSDFVKSKDIPCNNWLHFIIRDDRLHMNVAIRSNDVVWGFSGINAFEWSVLHEMMAYWTHCEVGDSSFFISSFHIYERHYRRAQAMAAFAKDRTLYDFGFKNTSFHTPLEAFDEALSDWFELENRFRESTKMTMDDLDTLEDDFLRDCARMLYVYNRHLADASLQEIAELVQNLPSGDFKIAAVEYFMRCPNFLRLISLAPHEENYFQYFRETAQRGAEHELRAYSISDVYDLLKVLHYKKTLVYKESWKKHGEVIGVFANISRKFDRIESIVVHQSRATADETLVDTVADLAVYAAKYLTYLAEHYPALFTDFISQYGSKKPVVAYSHNMYGFDLTADILAERYRQSGDWANISNYPQCFEMIQDKYKTLENILVTGDCRLSDPRKCSLAANLSISAVHYLSLLSQENPQNFAKFVDFVEKL